MAEEVTRELRWFFEGSAPTKVSAWFEQLSGGADLIKVKERTDVYFLVEGHEEFGVKLREGKLELKWRTLLAPFMTIDEKHSGKQVEWRKQGWECADHSEIEKLFLSPQLGGPRYAVKKLRHQRKYSVNYAENRGLTPVGFGKPYPDKAVLIELTHLTSEDGTAWTLGFDGIAAPERVDKVLLLAADELLKDYPGPSLSVDAWAGYPRWLLSKLPSGV